MKLSEALTKDIRLICFTCPGYRRVNIEKLIAKHGEDTELIDVLKTESCGWCNTVGGLKIEREGLHRSFRKPPPPQWSVSKIWSALFEYFKRFVKGKKTGSV